MTYQEFLQNKRIVDLPSGIKNAGSLRLNRKLFDFQRDIVRWALKRGRACIWADCGLGKTPMQLEWSDQVCKHTKGSVLILTTLAVSEQTALIEAPKFGIKVQIAENQEQCIRGINITNYEKLNNFDLSQFAGIVLDESSILKNFAGKIRNEIISRSLACPFRLACTATPAPNDFMELGNHAEFVGAMKYSEMLSMFFVHDGGDTAKWRLKGHAKTDFFAWVASWAVMLRKPSDLGYPDTNFTLPELRVNQITIETESLDGFLFPVTAETLQERQQARRCTIEDRAKKAAEIIAQNKSKDNSSWCVWCNLNDEAAAMEKLRPGMVNIQGSDSNEKKAAAMLGFAKGDLSEIVTKPSIAGMGINWQECHNTIFLGLSDSYEQYYQAVRRFWRFGQKKPVNVYIVTADVEGNVVDNIRRKEADADKMYDEMVKNMSITNAAEVHGLSRSAAKYLPEARITMPNFL